MSTRGRVDAVERSDGRRADRDGLDAPRGDPGDQAEQIGRAEHVDLGAEGLDVGLVRGRVTPGRDERQRRGEHEPEHDQPDPEQGPVEQAAGGEPGSALGPRARPTPGGGDGSATVGARSWSGATIGGHRPRAVAWRSA